MRCEDVDVAMSEGGKAPRPAEVEAHLRTCASCRETLEFLEHVDEGLREPLWLPPGGFARAVANQGLAIIQARAAEPPLAVWVNRLTAWILAGTAALLVVCAGRLLGPLLAEELRGAIREPVAVATIYAAVSCAWALAILYRVKLRQSG